MASLVLSGLQYTYPIMAALGFQELDGGQVVAK